MGTVTTRRSGNPASFPGKPVIATISKAKLLAGTTVNAHKVTASNRRMIMASQLVGIQCYGFNMSNIENNCVFTQKYSVSGYF